MFIFGAIGAVLTFIAGIFINIGTRILVMTISGVLILLFFAWMAGRAL